MKSKDPVSMIMSTNVHFVNMDDDVESAVKIMKEKKIRHLPVKDVNKVVGILSMGDVKWVDNENLAIKVQEKIGRVTEELKVSDLMTKNPYAISSSTRIGEAAEILAREPYHALPVMDGTALAGIVTTTDLISYLVSE